MSRSGRPGDERRVALLRGVNLAARRRVSMADLRDLVTGLGYADVATLLQSGNVVLSSDEPPTRVAERIAGAIAERLGMDVDVIVRTGRELQEVVAANPLAQHADEGKWLHVLFLSDAPDPEAVRGLEEEDVAPDAIRLGGREIYIWTPDGVRRSPAMAAVERRRLGVSVTARNWNTVRKLAAMVGG